MKGKIPKILSVALALVLVLSFSLVAAVPAGAQDPAVFQSGGDRLVVLQNDDGGWGWPLEGVSASNTNGPIGIGLAEAYLRTNDAGMYAALEKTGGFLLAKTNTFTCWDGYLAVQLDSIFGGTTYTDYVKTNFYDKLAAGTYERKDDATLYSTDTYIAAAGYAWDLGIGLVSAVSVGIDQNEVNKWIDGVRTAIDGLDNPEDPYYPSDLAGGLYGLAYAGVTVFTGTVGGTSMTSVAALAAELASLQADSGAFSEGAELAQDTAYALLALNQFDRSGYIDNITRAGDYLENAQLGTGGWLNGETEVENNEMTGEALWALSAKGKGIALDAPYYEPGDTVTVTVVDFDANTHAAYIDTVKVIANNTVGDTLKDIVLEETGVNSGIFTGSFLTTDAFPAPEGQLYVEDYEEFDAGGDYIPGSKVNDTITVTYGEGGTALTVEAAVNNDWPEVTLDLPDELVNNDTEVVEVPSTTTNPEYGLPYNPVIFVVTIDAPQALATDDVVLDPELGGVKVVDGNLVGFWGPAEGFLMTAPYGAPTTFDAKVVSGPLGTYTVNVDLLDLTFPEEGGAAYGENEYHVLASVSDTTEVVPAESLMVTVPKSVAVKDVPTTIDVTIQGEDFKGPGTSPGTSDYLDYVDIIVTGPNVSYSLAKAYWTDDTTWKLFEVGGDLDLPTGATGVDADTISFEVAPNMANEDITVEVTGYTYDAETGFTPVGPAVPKTVPVLGYALYNYPTDDVSVDQTGSLSLDVKTKDGNIVNSAIVTFSAGSVDAFGKDFDESGEIEADEDFAQIIFDGDKITYKDATGVEVGESDPYYVNNGHYEVTNVTFVDVADVSIDIEDIAGSPTVAAFLNPAFSIIGVDLYDVSLDPATVTAGIETSVVVTVTKGGAPVTAIDSIKLDSVELLGASTSATGEYTITVPATPEAGTPTVMVTGEDGQKYGTDDLTVALPVVDYTIYETVDEEEVERNVMLATDPVSNYTVDVTVNDALGEALDGYLWIGTYDEATETFDDLATATITDGIVEDLAVTAPGEAGSLVWMIGSSDALDGQALVPTPAIAVEEPAYSLDYETPVIAGESVTVSVLNNYEELRKYMGVIVRNPDSTTDPFSTGNTGTFTFTPAVAGDYEVYTESVSAANFIDTITVAVKVLESIAAEPSEVSLLVDETEQLTVTATYSDETTADVTAEASYESNDTSVATVSEAGLITGVAVGDATVTVSYDTETTTVLVTVSEEAVFDVYELYDADEDGAISKTEALTAVADYFDSGITKAQALLVIVEYMG